MEGKQGIISGVVCDPSGAPVAGVRVYFMSGPVPLPEIAALTDSDGTFFLSAPEKGTYTIGFNAEGFLSEVVAVTAATGQEMHLDIRLKK